MNFRFKPRTLVYSDFTTAMGLSSATPMSAPAPGTAQWPFKGFVVSGNRLHGDSTSASFYAAVWAAYPSGSAGDIAARNNLLNSPFGRIAPWFLITPSANNRCTNAGFLVTDPQCQIFSISQNRWIPLTTNTDRTARPTCSYYQLANIAYDTACDIIYPNRYNWPIYNPVKVVGDRASADSSPPTTSKYRIIHSGSARLDYQTISGIPYTDVGAVFTSYGIKMVSTDGAAFNHATNEYLCQIGTDGYYNDDALGAGVYTGISVGPPVGASGMRMIPTDGSMNYFYMVTAKVSTDMYVDNTTVYSVANGADSVVMTSDNFAANIPQLLIY